MTGTAHGKPRLAANDVPPGALGGPEGWDWLVGEVVSDRLASPFQQDTRAHWEVTGPAGQDPDFAVSVAVSGGMDSAALIRMAAECSAPAERVFFDLGQPYAAHELQSLDRRRVEFLVHTELPAWKDYGGIMIGRNTLVALRCAQRLHERGRWGEVWIGAVAGENDWRGGDKSQRWLADLNGILARAGVDVRVVAPLEWLDKSDVVALALAGGWAEELAATKSCHRGDVWACGACKTCFRKWAAFGWHGLARLVEDHHAAPPAAFAGVAREYAAWIERPGSKYGLRRRESLRRAIRRVQDL